MEKIFVRRAVASDCAIDLMVETTDSARVRPLLERLGFGDDTQRHDPGLVDLRQNLKRLK